MVTKPARDQRTPSQSHSSGSYRETGMGLRKEIAMAGSLLIIYALSLNPLEHMNNVEKLAEYSDSFGLIKTIITPSYVLLKKMGSSKQIPIQSISHIETSGFGGTLTIHTHSGSKETISVSGKELGNAEKIISSLISTGKVDKELVKTQDKQEVNQGKRFLKILGISTGGFFGLFIFIAIIAVISGGSSNENPVQDVAPSVISYSVLREWNPDNDPSALGLEILISEEDARPVNITNLVRNLSGGREKVVIKVYQDKKAWEESEVGEYTDVFNKGYLAFYVKNLTGSGAYRGFNEIRWMQEGGELDSLFGSKTQL